MTNPPTDEELAEYQRDHAFEIGSVTEEFTFRCVREVQRLRAELAEARRQLKHVSAMSLSEINRIGSEKENIRAEYLLMRAQRDKLAEALRSRGTELPDGTDCFCGLFDIAGEHTKSCLAARAALRELEGK